MLIALFISLLALAACQNAYMFTVQVTISQGTAAFGTNVTIIQNGVVLYQAQAEQQGPVRIATANFSLSPGSYFVILSRANYPQKVILLEMNSDTQRQYTLSTDVSYSTAYGQITGPSDFSQANVSIYSYSAPNVRAAVAQPDANGYYLASYLPEGNYRFLFTDPGYQNESVDVYLPVSASIPVDVWMNKTIAVLPSPPALSAPSQVQQYGLIEVTLMQGAEPMAGQAIAVQTPSGPMQATTDSDGIARINAALPGTYAFSYNDLSAQTTVPSPEASNPNASAVVAPVPHNENVPAVPAETAPVQPSGSPILLVLLGALGVAIVIAAIMLYYLMKLRSGKKKDQAEKEGGAKEAHEHHGASAHHKHAHEAHEKHKE
jgi:hypothetical protein